MAQRESTLDQLHACCRFTFMPDFFSSQDTRRRKLEDLQNREAIKAKRIRLQALLIQKLTGKYAGK